MEHFTCPLATCWCSWDSCLPQHHAQAHKAASHSTAWAEHLPSGPIWGSCHPLCSLSLGFCSTCSPGRHLLCCCHSPPLPSMMLCLLNPQSSFFSSVFHSSHRGPTIELLGLQEFTRSDFNLCRILLRAGLRRCHHLYPESSFSFSYLTLALSYLTHGIRDLSMLFFIITSWCFFSPLKLPSILPPSFPISPIIPRPQPWRFCSFSKRGRLLEALS